jgi:hypothetical protein
MGIQPSRSCSSSRQAKEKENGLLKMGISRRNHESMSGSGQSLAACGRWRLRDGPHMNSGNCNNKDDSGLVRKKVP